MIRPTVETNIKFPPKLKKLQEMLKKYKNAYVSVGLFENHEELPYQGKNPPSVVEVGLWMEFGTKTVPERSWMRSTMADSSETINKWREEVVKKIIFEGLDVHKALEILGFRVQILLQNKIKSNVAPPLAESTKRQKAAKGQPAVSLIATTNMIRSVTYKVHLS